MPLLIIYILKFSIGLAVVYLFYQLLLRRLTFYNYNRWYLLGYSLLCFFIPFINISSFVESAGSTPGPIVHLIPSIENYTGSAQGLEPMAANISHAGWSRWNLMLVVMIVGAGILLVRFFIQFISFLKMRNRAQLISGDDVNLYHVNEPVIPFSFGNSVFVNSSLHSGAELQEIVRHEFVHVKQRHTMDIVWCELICMLNWYNPFAWLLKASIRQNLEFIADNKVVRSGINKKEYQYLLLKVIGNNQYSIAPKFNFSSLKKRIAMMNKMKTARVHMIRFLFVLPLLTVLLISFRSRQKEFSAHSTQFFLPNDGHDNIPPEERSMFMRDTVPDGPNDKGYYVHVTGNKNNATVVIKDKDGRTIQRIPYDKWKEKETFYSDKYGELDAPPVPPLPPTPPTPPPVVEMPANVKRLEVQDKQASVILNDGTKETYDLNKPEEKAKFEKKYGDIIPPPPVPPVPPSRKIGITSVSDAPVKGEGICDNFEITDHKAIMRLKDGTTEQYDLTKSDERKKFENKYGMIVESGSGDARIASNEAVTVVGYGTNKTEPVTVVGYGKNRVEPVVAGTTINKAEPVTVVGYGINKAGPVTVTGQAITNNEPVTVVGYGINRTTAGVINENGITVAGERELLLTISKKTTQQDLDGFVKQMKEKGIHLKIDNSRFRDGILIHINGTMKYKGSQANFSATDFSRVIFSKMEDGNQIYFQVETGRQAI